MTEKSNGFLIKGPRLYLRNIEIDDIDKGWLDWVNDRNLVKHLTMKPPVSRKSLVEYYNQVRSSGDYMFAVCDLDTNKYIGNAKICHFDTDRESAFCGRLIGRKDFQGKGYGTELLCLLLAYGFNVLNLIELKTGVNESNIPSIKSNKKAGMSITGKNEKAVYINGRCEDAILFGMTSHQFNNKNLKSHMKFSFP